MTVSDGHPHRHGQIMPRNMPPLVVTRLLPFLVTLSSDFRWLSIAERVAVPKAMPHQESAIHGLRLPAIHGRGKELWAPAFHVKTIHGTVVLQTVIGKRSEDARAILLAADCAA